MNYVCKLRLFFQSPNVMCEEEGCPVRPAFKLAPGNCLFYRVTFCKDCGLYPGDNLKCMANQTLAGEFFPSCKRFHLKD